MRPILVVVIVVSPFVTGCGTAQAGPSVDGPASLTHGWYRLGTKLHGERRCLEGNRATGSAHDGNAFMDECQNVTGQIWRFVEDGGGWYRLKTRFRGETECLDGNQASSRIHHGAAFMDDCREGGSSQRWEVVEVGGGWARLKTELGGEEKCLEGNDVASGGHGGSAFLDDCRDATGQLWRFEPDRAPERRGRSAASRANRVAQKQ